MNDFFRSKTFKIIAVLLAAVLAFFLRAVYTGGLMPALSHIGGAVATPFGEFFAGIGNGIQHQRQQRRLHAGARHRYSACAG